MHRIATVAVMIFAASVARGADAPVPEPYAGLVTALHALADGRSAEGLAVLEALLRSEADDPVSRAVRDRARLALAHHYLHAGDAELARQHFQKVHSPGPYAGDALLGLGWSWLLPAATRNSEDGSGWHYAPAPLRPGGDDATAHARRQTPMRYWTARASGEREDDLRMALAAWQELVGRDPVEPAVQEGMLAIAWAFSHLGAHEQSLRRYLLALELLQEARGLLLEAVQHVESGELIAALRARDQGAGDDRPWWLLERRAARWWMDTGVEADPIFYVEHLLRDDAFRRALQAYRPDGGGTEMQRRAVEAAALSGLRARLQTVEGYLVEAHLALARIHDPPLDGRARARRAEAPS